MLRGHLAAGERERLEDCRPACAPAPDLREHWEVLKSDLEQFVQGCEGMPWPSWPVMALQPCRV